MTDMADIDPQTQDQAGDIEEVAPVVPSVRSRPDAHTQRYDRQLRLWASSGQASLESSHVLLVGATHLGAQVLKNLILPGIGSFTILDGQKVGANDLGNNFFLEPDSEGKDRASEVAKYLSELNPSVKSNARVADPAQALAVDAQWFASFSLIIAANQPSSVLYPLADLAWNARSGIGIPLLSVRGAGMLGQVQVQVREMGIIETHPASTTDLRLTDPWPELSAYSQAYDIDDKDALAHSHIPFIIILLRVLDQWRSEHDGALPTTSTDRKPLSDRINSLRDLANLDTENFDEAIAALGQNVWRPISSGRKVPADIETLFSDPACENVSTKSTNFWLLIRALRNFVQAPVQHSPSGGGGHLPLPGSLPDFKAQSSTYVEVQRLFKQKAQCDLEGLKGHLHAVLQEVGLPKEAIGDEEVESFAKHAGYVKLVRGRSLSKRHALPDKEAGALAFMDPINPPTIQHHLSFIAIDRFQAQHGRYPGSARSFSDSITGASSSSSSSSHFTPWRRGSHDGNEPSAKRQKSESPYPSDVDGDARMPDAQEVAPEATVDLEADEKAVLGEAERIAKKWGLDQEQEEMVLNSVREMTRSGHADIASTASLLGGVTAQEAIKLITKQYIPLQGTAVYDGIKQAIGSFSA